jgi:hypothetical protein
LGRSTSSDIRLHSLSLSHPEAKFVRQPRPVRRERTVHASTPHHPWAPPRNVIFSSTQEHYISRVAHLDVVSVVFHLFCNILESDHREGLPSLRKHSLPPPSKPLCETLCASVLPGNWPRPDICEKPGQKHRRITSRYRKKVPSGAQKSTTPSEAQQSLRSSESVWLVVICRLYDRKAVLRISAESQSGCRSYAGNY